MWVLKLWALEELRMPLGVGQSALTHANGG